MAGCGHSSLAGLTDRHCSAGSLCFPSSASYSILCAVFVPRAELASHTAQRTALIALNALKAGPRLPAAALTGHIPDPSGAPGVFPFSLFPRSPQKNLRAPPPRIGACRKIFARPEKTFLAAAAAFRKPPFAVEFRPPCCFLIGIPGVFASLFSFFFFTSFFHLSCNESNPFHCLSHWPRSITEGYEHHLPLACTKKYFRSISLSLNPLWKFSNLSLNF